MSGHDRVLASRVTSLKDPKVVEARELTSARGRLRHAKALLYGIDQLEWARRETVRVERVFVVEDALDVVPGWVAESLPVLLVSDGVSKKITDTSYVVPLVAVAQAPSPETGAAGDLALVIDDVCDAGNIGALVRTARGFGVRDIWSTTPDLDLTSRKAIDASRGLVLGAHLRRCASPQEAVALLRTAGYEIVVTSPHAPELQSRAQLSGRPLAVVVAAIRLTMTS